MTNRKDKQNLFEHNSLGTTRNPNLDSRCVLGATSIPASGRCGLGRETFVADGHCRQQRRIPLRRGQ
jgi:hypothetical protein